MYSYKIMRNCKNLVFMSEKEIYKTGSVSYLVLSATDNDLKNVSATVNATRHATRIFLRGANQNFFCIKFV